MMESWEHEESEEELGEKSTFPGLNKAHGFFHLIKRNQKDRDSYHQQQEERREARRLEVKKEWQSEREARRRPPLALYRPPHQRSNPRTRGPTNVASQPAPPQHKSFHLQVEVQPEQWWNGVIECGHEEAVADLLVEKYGLMQTHKTALLHMMQEFRDQHL